MRTYCTRILEFDAAHRVMRHESKCATVHGHRYKVEVTCAADELDDVGRVIDFGVLKEKVGGWIEGFWDHTTIVNRADLALLDFLRAETQHAGKRPPWVMDDEPTAENMARFMLSKAQELVGTDGLRVVHVRVWETPNCYADARAPDTIEVSP